MKKLFIAVFLLVCPALFAQQITPNQGAPDQIQGGHLAPYIGSAGQTFSCQVVPYEAWYSPMPSGDMVEMKMGPCGWSIDQFGSYTTLAPFHLQAIHCWIGTSSNTRFEVVSNMQIWVQDIHGVWHMMIDHLCEFDKHQDVTGNTDKFWTLPVPIDLPAGFMVNVYRYPGGFIHCGDDYWRIEGTTVPYNSATGAGTQSNPDGNNPSAATVDKCATEIHWRLYGTGK